MKHTLALSLLLAAGSEAAAVAPRDTGCSDVHIFLAKGNNEPYPGRQGKLVNAICNGLSSCDYEDIKFYNPGNSNYCTSVSEGSANGVSQIEAYNKKCPNAKLVISGYSQGGDVAGNVLGGLGGTVFGCQVTADSYVAADSAAGKKIVAGLFFGDVRHTGGQSYNVLDGAPNDGVAPRSGQGLANINAYGSALRSYCAAADPICAKGNTVADHLNYFDIYTDAAAAWVQERIKAADGTSASSSASSGASKTAAASHVVTAAPTKGWSNSTSSVTVPAYGNDIDTITYKPNTEYTTVTEVTTVTSECPSKGLVLTQTKTVTVECPICQYVSSYTKTASSPPSEKTGGNGGSPSKTVPATSATITAPVGGGSYKPNNGTVTGGQYSPNKPTPVPSVPVGVSAASAHLPQLGGMLVAVAALMAF